MKKNVFLLYTTFLVHFAMQISVRASGTDIFDNAAVPPNSPNFLAIPSFNDNLFMVAEDLGLTQEEVMSMFGQEEIDTMAINLNIERMQGLDPVNLSPDPIVNEIHIRAERAKGPVNDYLKELNVVSYTSDEIALRELRDYMNMFIGATITTAETIHTRLVASGYEGLPNLQGYIRAIRDDHEIIFLQNYMNYVTSNREYGDQKEEERRLEHYYQTDDGFYLLLCLFMADFGGGERKLLEEQINTLATFMIFPNQTSKNAQHCVLFHVHKQNAIKVLNAVIHMEYMKNYIDRQLQGKIDASNPDCPFQKFKKQIEICLDDAHKVISMNAVIAKILRSSDYYNDQFYATLKAYLPFVEQLGRTSEEKKNKMETWLAGSFGESAIAHEDKVLENKISCETGIVDRMTTGLKYLDKILDDKAFNVWEEVFSEGRGIFERYFQDSSFRRHEKIRALFMENKPYFEEKGIDFKTISIEEAKDAWCHFQKERLYNIIIFENPEAVSEDLIAQVAFFREDIIKIQPTDPKIAEWKQKQMDYIYTIVDDETIMDWNDIVRVFQENS